MPLPSHASRIKVKASLLKDDSRIREDYSHVESLAESIAERGLIQPIVITADYTVVDGGSRLKACRDILKYEDVDVVFMENMSEADLRILEVEANIRRKDFTWQERVIAVCRVHELKFAAAALAGERWGQRQTGELLGQSLGNVNSVLLLGGLIRQKDKEILACASAGDALKLCAKRKEQEATKLLATATIPSGGAGLLNQSLGTPTDITALLAVAKAKGDTFFAATPVDPTAVTIAAPTYDEDPTAGDADVSVPAINISLSDMLYRGDCLTHMAAMSPDSIDHVITDIPYGIDMSNLQQSNSGMDISSVRLEHGVDENVSLMQRLLPAVFRVLKPGGFFIFWYDLDHHEKLQSWATAAGFRVQAWPIIWHKTHTCLNQAAGKNFTKNYEVAMGLSKGNATLISAQGSSIWTGGNEDIKSLLQHPFVKPFKLWRWLFDAVTVRGQTVYDPFAGVGSSTLAAIEHGLKPLASELNDEHFNRLVVNVSNRYRATLKNVNFQ